MNRYSFLIFAFLMKRTSGLRSFGLMDRSPSFGAGASRMHGCSDPFGGRSPSGHVYGRRGCSLLIRLGAFCSYLGSSPARGSLIFAFSMNTYSFLILALLMRRTSGLLGRAVPVRGRSQPYAWALGPILRTVPERARTQFADGLRIAMCMAATVGPSLSGFGPFVLI